MGRRVVLLFCRDMMSKEAMGRRKYTRGFYNRETSTIMRFCVTLARARAREGKREKGEEREEERYRDREGEGER